jgi:hypothetical protein
MPSHDYINRFVIDCQQGNVAYVAVRFSKDKKDDPLYELKKE